MSCSSRGHVGYQNSSMGRRPRHSIFLRWRSSPCNAGWICDAQAWQRRRETKDESKFSWDGVPLLSRLRFLILHGNSNFLRRHVNAFEFKINDIFLSCSQPLIFAILNYYIHSCELSITDSFGKLCFLSLFKMDDIFGTSQKRKTQSMGGMLYYVVDNLNTISIVQVA